jgi:hypothetical protein
MTIVWIVIGVAGAIAAVIARSHHRARTTDLGVVSHQWLAEHRLSQTPDSHR